MGLRVEAQHGSLPHKRKREQDEEGKEAGEREREQRVVNAEQRDRDSESPNSTRAEKGREATKVGYERDTQTRNKKEKGSNEASPFGFDSTRRQTIRFPQTAYPTASSSSSRSIFFPNSIITKLPAPLPCPFLCPSLLSPPPPLALDEVLETLAELEWFEFETDPSQADDPCPVELLLPARFLPPLPVLLAFATSGVATT